MRYSQLLIPTLKEAPSDAEVISHKLMVRAGMIRQLASGIYSILPLGLRVLRKVEQIIREEMNAVGGQEMFLPSIQPAELWQESGRWDFYGKELLRIKDRHDREFCYGPTHEEVITDIVRREVRSYRQLPLVLYQIQTKFRDEVRPRFGVMRGREFTMKDAYSFHANEQSVQATYEDMKTAYNNVFRRCGLDFKMVEADSGTIGGSFSHEFMVLASSGEDAVVFCDACGYASNLEKAAARAVSGTPASNGAESLAEVSTPGQKTVDAVTGFLKITPDKLVKTLILENENGLLAGLVRGDRQLNPIKLKNLLGCEWLHPAAENVIQEKTGLPVGYVGPVNLPLPVYADHEVTQMQDFVTGANKIDAHFTGVQFARDLKVEQVGDLRTVEEGDPCPHCDGGVYQIRRGIEVGHIFVLGTKYSDAMKAGYLDENGKEKTLVMGCYGIGVGRTAAAAIEQNHDDKGIVWPVPLAPFQVVILPTNYSDDAVKAAADTAYRHLTGLGVEVLLDDRSDRLGVKFKDAELIGFPLQLVIGPKNLEQGEIELKTRNTGESATHPFPAILDRIPSLLDAL
ncbi:proline--tRNA ligase [Nitrospina watsonii]|uniref:Proline--tRNA ligase n=1 Tax=Nitrospina watsonii TaxID=1323948 RepID=A0ABN8W143_9BACT|nr:proline--tRNA ligase [Nitrospina watsonii]CAI2717926.1 proline--tRNA ligase [Nitrospina watsonii]